MVEAIQRKIWYLWIDHRKLGPYSLSELEMEIRLTKDTLVWRPGFDHWMKARYVRELRHLFHEPEQQQEEEEGPPEPPAGISPEGLVIDLRGDQPPTGMWILLLLALLVYLAMRMFYS